MHGSLPYGGWPDRVKIWVCAPGPVPRCRPNLAHQHLLISVERCVPVQDRLQIQGELGQPVRTGARPQRGDATSTNLGIQPLSYVGQYFWAFYGAAFEALVRAWFAHAKGALIGSVVRTQTGRLACASINIGEMVLKLGALAWATPGAIFGSIVYYCTTE